MLSGWCNIFSPKEPCRSYYKLGGPRSFHKFQYKKTNIILIGEVHKDIENELAKEYLDVFNHFTETHHVKLFLESAVDEITNTSSDKLSFIDCMLTLTPSSNLERIHSDKRYSNDGFNGLFKFITIIDVCIEGMIKGYKKIGVTPPSPMIFEDKKVFLEPVLEIADECNKRFYLPDLFKMLESSLDILHQLMEKYSAKNKILGGFLAEHFLEVNVGYELLQHLENKCRLLGYDDEKMKTQPIIDICIDMMKNEGTFNPVYEWAHIYHLYASSFLSATLICDVWDEIEKDNGKERTLMVATGDAHTRHLSSFLKATCVTAASIEADKKGGIISPPILREFLNGDFEHAPSRNCVLF